MIPSLQELCLKTIYRNPFLLRRANTTGESGSAYKTVISNLVGEWLVKHGYYDKFFIRFLLRIPRSQLNREFMLMYLLHPYNWGDYDRVKIEKIPDFIEWIIARQRAYQGNRIHYDHFVPITIFP
jgi:hypothetical protein